MQSGKACNGPVMRLFEVQAKKGCAGDLLQKFATTSADVVRHEPGNRGYFFGRGAAGEEDAVFFASLWTGLDAIKERFGDDWQSSFLPPGYEDLIDSCSLRHFDLASGWHVDLAG